VKGFLEVDAKNGNGVVGVYSREGNKGRTLKPGP